MSEMICIVCPKGCHLRVEAEPFTVAGNACERGVEYARTELLHPTRTLTSTVKLIDGCISRCPVRSREPIPKELIFAAMEEINRRALRAPVRMGDVAVANVAGTGVDIIVTRDID